LVKVANIETSSADSVARQMKMIQPQTLVEGYRYMLTLTTDPYERRGISAAIKELEAQTRSV